MNEMSRSNEDLSSLIIKEKRGYGRGKSPNCLSEQFSTGGKRNAHIKDVSDNRNPAKAG